MYEEIEQQSEMEWNKRNYEKPTLSEVQLFADMVLNFCNDAATTCPDDPEKMSG